MSSTVAPRAALVAALIWTLGCNSWYARQVEETRAGLLGRTGLELRECLGVPTDFAVDGDTETQSYHFEIEDERDAGFEVGRIDAEMRGIRVPGERGYEPRGFPLDDGPPPFCQLNFELTKGRVTHAAAQGRSREGMNLDSSCMLRAQACLPQSDTGESAE